MVHLTSCCCGCSLRTGSVLIGIYYAFQSLLLTGLLIWAAVTVDSEDLKYFSIGCACVFAVVTGISVLLIIGAAKKIPSLLKTWIITYTIIVSFCIVALVRQTISMGPNIRDISGTIFSIALTLYCIGVVKSYRTDLMTSSDCEPILHEEQPMAVQEPGNIDVV